MFTFYNFSLPESTGNFIEFHRTGNNVFRAHSRIFPLILRVHKHMQIINVIVMVTCFDLNRFYSSRWMYNHRFSISKLCIIEEGRECIRKETNFWKTKRVLRIGLKNIKLLWVWVTECAYIDISWRDRENCWGSGKWFFSAFIISGYSCKSLLLLKRMLGIVFGGSGGPYIGSRTANLLAIENVTA